MNHESNVKLDRPGAGLPFFESFIGRHFTFPKLTRSLTWQSAVDLFQRQGEKIVVIAESLSENELTHRVLIKRIRGIEDSSRFWSVGMVMKHLIMVGSDMLKLIQMLNRGETPHVKVDVADYKPKEIHDKSIIPKFIEMQKHNVDTLRNEEGKQNLELTHTHPWFGPINSFEWNCLAAIHQVVHKNQAMKIVEELRS